MKKMETVQKILRTYIIQVGSDEPIRSIDDYSPINMSVMEYVKSPLGIYEFSELIIYYPISRYGEFDPISIKYEITPDMSAYQLIKTMRDFYDQPVRT